MVATRVGGLTDALADGVTGLLVAPAGIRAALERLLADGELRRRLGEAARAHAMGEFGWARPVRELADAYAAASGSSGRTAR